MKSITFITKNNNTITLINGDFFSNKIENKINAIITDFPYGTLNKRNTWDKIWNFNNFWKIKNLICYENSPVISTASQPFTSYLISSNYKDFKYSLVWEKSKATGYLNAKKQPMRAHEDIVVFYKKQCTYNPQMIQGKPYDKGTAVRDAIQYSKQTKLVHVINESGMRYPRSVQYFVTAESEGKYHPTQKPISLYEWLVKTYTNQDELVLDPCFGSGTTAIACLKNNRNFIGYEKDDLFFKLAIERIQKNYGKEIKLITDQSNTNIS